MKNRLGMAFLAVTLAASMAGCTQKPASGQKVSPESDPEKIFAAAMENLRKETKKAAETKSVTSYEDGMEDEEHYTCILDEKKGIIERTAEGEDGEEPLYSCFNVKEKGGYGVYVNDELTGREWKYYKENLDADEESEYEYWLGEFDPFYTEEKGYDNIKYSNEGEDELNGEETVKIKATATVTQESSEESEAVTRESVLEDNEWSEEEVKAVPGFSEVLDAYVAASNKEEEPQTIECALTIWVRPEDSAVLKSRSAMNYKGAQDDAAKEGIEAFNNEYWKVDMVHQNVEEGMSPEEAKKELEKELKAMEQPKETESAEASGEEFEDEAAEASAAVTKVVVTKKIMTGKSCPDMSSLPKKYEEIKQEDYFEGGFELPEEDDYFSEGDEFEDEFE